MSVICVDKTGTLTKGTLSVSEIVGGGEVIERAAALEGASEHPLGRAVAAHARERGLALSPTHDFRAWPGLGVRGLVGHAPAANLPYDVAVGSSRFMERIGWTMDTGLAAEKMRLESRGRTIACVGWNGSVRGLIGFVEEIRPEADATVRELIADGLAVKALTGDDVAAGGVLSRRLGIAVHANLLPEDKVRLLAETQARLGAAAMVGDGLNDAPALARADVGIALGCGVDVTREAADVSLVGSDLRRVAWTIHLARQTYRVIRQNLWWAFVYNALGIGLAMVGVLHPIVSALAMVVSNLFVVGNSLRLAQRPMPETVEHVEETFVEGFAVSG
jgi:cation transport ATPase